MFDPNTLNQKIAALRVEIINGKVMLDHLHKITLNNNAAPEAKEWCESTFGHKWIWSRPMSEDNVSFYFGSTEDLLIFKLRYSGFLTT